MHHVPKVNGPPPPPPKNKKFLFFFFLLILRKQINTHNYLIYLYSRLSSIYFKQILIRTIITLSYTKNEVPLLWNLAYSKVLSLGMCNASNTTSCSSAVFSGHRSQFFKFPSGHLILKCLWPIVDNYVLRYTVLIRCTYQR